MFSIMRKLFANFLDDFNIICYWNKIFMKQTFYIYYILHFSKIFQKYIYIYITKSKRYQKVTKKFLIYR